MRLSRIKLSGFKTFVDSTSLNFPSNLTGIVGPNGCGKSNIIDAIRWVMGESSARNLRGETMDDVIFSGSSSRAEVSHASIELLFDNSLGKTDSKFAQFNEILIRREANRDGSSNYYLNNTRCRRKDIREVFLGTGLGPRSYAIIEQGMISKIVDSKPEELRTYLEEAAGISKYKEKRRETELRLKHTRENLSRLNDIMKEINASLTRLQKQANDAELYKNLKKEEEVLRIDIIAKKIINFDNELNGIEKDKKSKQIAKDKLDANITSLTNEIEKLRVSLDSEHSRYNKIQGESFHIAAEIARSEKDIEYTQQIQSTNKNVIDEINRDIEKSQNQINEIKIKRKENLESLDTNKKEKETIDTKINKSDQLKKEAIFALQNWQSNFNHFLSEKLELEKKVELEKSRIESYIENIRNLEKRLSQYVDADENVVSNNIQTDLLESSQLFQKDIINFKIDFERSIVELPKSKTKSLLSNLDRLIDKIKHLVVKIKENNKSITQQIKDISGNVKDYKDKVLNSESLLVEYNQKLQDYAKKQNSLEKEKIDLKQANDKAEWKLSELIAEKNNLNVKITTLNTELASFDDNLTRYEADVSLLKSKKIDILNSTDKPTDSDKDARIKLNQFLNQKKDKDNELTSSKNRIELIDKEIKDKEGNANALTITQSEQSTDINNIEIKIAEVKANKSSLLENSEFQENKILNAIKNLSDTPLSDDEQQLVTIKSKIEKLGAINLAAISELQEHNERKTYLDKQNNDLIKSVETLESAIKKIDQETKSKFKETFDSINKNLDYFFPKIFGGGKAYLELTDNDLLNTGVNMMAKPPGKLVKNLNLLSGGEKAGTGIAFVFSIFRINPAPFCLLDEVDAPLDEGNNDRFCNVVKEMSETVQFIFITHNKSTMKIADVLSGVTMREAGVSKLVSVNVEDALNMTNGDTQSSSS